MRERGRLRVGIDLIGDYLTEIIVTSPAGIRTLRNVMDGRPRSCSLPA